MRLTLRTLLAYLDDLLDPEDAEQLQRKIEDSEFATSLVHQIRGCVRQLRLDAPALDAQGVGGDLNSVAEYLDNVLPPDQVPTLEKACLENPISLGEIASCHQILTLVLGEPATFDDRVRQRAYAIAPTTPETPLPPALRENDPSTQVVIGDATGVDEPATKKGKDASGDDRTDSFKQQPHPAHSAIRSPNFARHEAAKSNGTHRADSADPSEGNESDNDASVENEATAVATPSESTPTEESTSLSTKEAWRREAQEGLPTDADEINTSVSGVDSQASDDHSTSKLDPKVGVGVAVPTPSGSNLALNAESSTEPNGEGDDLDVVTIPATPHQITKVAKNTPAADYLDRKITWQRSAFIAGMIALLLLLGAMFASRPNGNSYFAEWFGSGRLVAGHDQASTPNENSPAESPQTARGIGDANAKSQSGDATNTTIAATSQAEEFPASELGSQTATTTPEPTRWIDPSQTTQKPSLRSDVATAQSAFNAEQPINAETPQRVEVEQPIRPPTGGIAQGVPGDSKPASVSEGSGPPAPPELTNSLTPNPKLAAGETLTPAIATQQTNSVPADATSMVDPLPEVQPEANVRVDRDPASPNLANELKATEPGPANVVSVTRDLPPRQDEPLNVSTESEPTTAAVVSNLNRANVARTNTSPQTDSSVPIVDTEIELPTQEEPIRPPVASTTSVVTDIPADQRLPIDSGLAEAPEPPSSITLPPTKLRRGGQLLLVLDTEANDWKRVDSTVTLDANDVLQCLPSFRADLAIGASTMCTLVDATRIKLGPQDNITLQDGRILLKSQDPDSSQSIRYRGVLLDITGTGNDSAIAIEASRPHIPGTELTEAPHSLLQIHSLSGEANIQLMGQSFELGDGQKLVLLDGYPPYVAPADRLPLWATRTTPLPRDSGVVKNWQKSIPHSESMELWLKDRATQRYQRRALAARCLAELGDYAAIVTALGDVEQHAYWEDHFATLRRHLTRGTDWVEKLQFELQVTHGDDAKQMMELIRGYSGAQLANGAAQDLVSLLRSDKLEFRVLAFHNLRSITGAELGYEPEATDARRRVPTGSWEKRQQSGLRYRTVSTIERLLKAAAKQ